MRKKNLLWGWCMAIMLTACGKVSDPVNHDSVPMDEVRRMDFLIACPALIKSVTSDELSHMLIRSMGENRMQAWCNCALDAAMQEAELKNISDAHSRTPLAARAERHDSQLAALHGLKQCAKTAARDDQDTSDLLKEALRLIDQHLAFKTQRQ